MTYTCPFCKKEMLHQPNNERITHNTELKVKVGDTFKCGCSIKEIDSDNSIYLLNSWKFEQNEWYHLGRKLVWEKVKRINIPQFDFNPSRR